jgi:dihydrofolate synthase/folylpolyglutamate synthase
VTYAEAVPWLYGMQWHGIKLGLENIARLLAELRVPIRGEGAPLFLHVAGTNGKGSVCAMLDSSLRAAGYRSGLFTSPHLVSFRERIRVNGEMISESAAAAILTRTRQLIERWEQPPTFFEITTALALAHFAASGVQYAVLETGLGGRLDATNIVTPLVSVITAIGLDHQQYLGETIAAVAMEKGGIIKPGVPTVTGPQESDAQCAIMHLAYERDAPFHLVLTPMKSVELGLAGSHQRWNGALAVHALEVAGITVPDHAMVAGLRDVQWPGRFQQIGERLILDGAHNPAAAQRLAQTWREQFGEAKATVILGAMKDKDLRGICAALAPIASAAIAVPIQNERALPPQELRRIWTEAAPGIPCTVAANLREALDFAAREAERTLVTGSLFLVGEVLQSLEGGGDGRASAQ